VLSGCEVIVSLKEVFREQLAQRYASYAGRVGTDDVIPINDLENFRNTLFDEIAAELSTDEGSERN
jgi:hypothetical protein